MANELQDKVAIITGGARSIGAATVRLFVEEGARVVIADIRDDMGEALADELGESAVYKHTDVSKAEDIEALIAFTVKHFGGLDTLFSNAGIMGDTQSHFLDENFESFHKTINVDLLGPMLGAKYAGRYMKEHGGGSIITTSSSTALFGGYGIVPYRAAKAGIHGMTKGLAIELGSYNIRVNSISPGPTRSDIFADMIDNFPPDKLEALKNIGVRAMMDRMPIKRMGEPKDIANAAMFLASDRAVQITGIDLLVDGGETVGNLDNTSERMEREMKALLSSL